MSAILALIARDGDDIAETRLRALVDELDHRGPDGDGIWSRGPVGLGHQRHCTTPEAHVATPPEQSGSLVLTANVRLDNRPELISTFGLSSVCRTITDHELLCRAYGRWETGCPKRLLGAFAFAVWDTNRERLFCARDHMGVKPLFYTQSDRRIALASEPSPLLALPDVRRVPNERRVGDYLVGVLDDERAGFHTDISRLPPGHWLSVTEEEIRTRQYWDPEDITPRSQASDIDYRRRFRELFTDAVDARLRTNGRPGSLLSGGLDSSSITSVAAARLDETANTPLNTFSAIFETVTECSEREYIDAVVDRGCIDPHFVHGDRINPLENVDQHLNHLQGPYYPSLFMLIPRLYREAAATDTDIVLHGYGGDQTMGSDVRGYLRGLARRGKLHTLARELRSYCSLYPWSTPREVLWSDILTALVPRSLRTLWHARYHADHYCSNTFAAVRPEFARRAGIADRLALEAIRPPPRSQQAIRRRALMSGEPTFNLELNDIVGGIIGVEPRYPYFDKRLVEFALTLPPGQTVHRGRDRTLVRDALADLLPTAVRNRTGKMEFSPNVVHTVRRYAMDGIESTLFDGSPSVGDWMAADELRRAFEELQSTDDVIATRNLLMATTLERWLTTCVDKSR